VSRALALTLALVLAVPAAAQTVEPGRISVLGRATVEREPDHAVVQVGVLTKAPTPNAALDQNSAIAARIIAFAKEFGVAARDLRTASVNLTPVTKSVRNPDGSFRQEPDGYQAGNTVQVTLSDISRLGTFLRDVLNQGANQIAGVRFALADPDAAMDEALAGAVADATRKAARLAQAANAKLGRVQRIAYPPDGGARPFAAAAPSPRALRQEVPIEAGALETSAEVEMTWALE
jgi:uncharacterized protein